MVLDREAILDRIERGLTTAADAEALRRWLRVGRSSRRARAMPARRTVLGDEQVREMRQTWQSWRAAGVAGRPGRDGKGYGSLAEIYGVATSTARDIVTGRTRRWAGGPIDGDRRHG